MKEYIETGILEAYVLGQLEEHAKQEVEANIEKYPELADELKSIELTIEGLMFRTGRQPSSQTRAELFKSITSAKHGATLLHTTSASVVLWKYATAASIVFAIASSVLAYIFWSNWKRTEIDLEERVAQSRQMAEDLHTVSERLDKIESDLNIYDNPLFQKVVMNGTANSPGSMASVYWNQNTKEVFLSVQHLKELARDQQYQLWAIVNGKPVDLGVFDMPSGGLTKMNEASGATAFAITIEPRGGKPTPTMETMQVIGSA